MTLRALTLHRPWAHAIAHLGKSIENRSWRPPASAIDTWIAIHAGKKLDREALAELRAAGFTVPDDGGPGGVVAVAHLCGDVEVERYYRGFPLRPRGDRVRAVVAHGERWLSGPIGWCFDEVVTIAEPVPCRGAQGLWVIPPREAALVRKRFEAARGRAA